MHALNNNTVIQIVHSVTCTKILSVKKEKENALGIERNLQIIKFHQRFNN
jgi:hypothetical protein